VATVRCSFKKLVKPGESEYSAVLKIRKLLIFRDAKNAEHGKIALNWNVSGTQTFHHARQFREEGLPSPATPNSFPEHGTIKALIAAVAAERASK